MKVYRIINIHWRVIYKISLFPISSLAELLIPFCLQYRVAAIFPERFQCFTVALKIIFFNIFFRKTVLSVCRNIIINKECHFSKDESTGRHRSRERLRALRRVYHDRDEELLEISTRAQFPMVKKCLMNLRETGVG